MAHEHSIACCSNDHAEDGEPNVCHSHRRVHAVTDAQHVTHGLEEGIRVLLSPRIILQGGKKDTHPEAITHTMLKVN